MTPVKIPIILPECEAHSRNGAQGFDVDSLSIRKDSQYPIAGCNRGAPGPSERAGPPGAEPLPYSARRSQRGTVRDTKP